MRRKEELTRRQLRRVKVTLNGERMTLWQAMETAKRIKALAERLGKASR